MSVGALYVAKILGRELLTVCPEGGATSPIAGGVVAAESVPGASMRGAALAPTLKFPYTGIWVTLKRSGIVNRPVYTPGERSSISRPVR